METYQIHKLFCCITNWSARAFDVFSGILISIWNRINIYYLINEQTTYAVADRPMNLYAFDVFSLKCSKSDRDKRWKTPLQFVQWREKKVKRHLLAAALEQIQCTAYKNVINTL